MEVKDSSYIAFPDFLFIISSAQAVSYTHLDVYKRQVYSLSKIPCTGIHGILLCVQMDILNFLAKIILHQIKCHVNVIP